VLRFHTIALSLLLLASCECGSGGASEERRTIAVIPKGTTHIFWRAVHAGAQTAANDEGVDIVWQGPVREDDRAAQIRVVEDMISRRVDAIVLAPLDDTALVPVATEAVREGIPA
jgi:ribose transport system substrate-binding protein